MVRHGLMQMHSFNAALTQGANVMIKRTAALLLTLVILLAAVLPMAGCSSDKNNFPVSVAGVTISERPEKVICLSSEYTEIIVSMGYTRLLVGRPYDCTNADVQNITSVGTASSPALDLILGLEADLLIADTDTSSETLQQIEESGVQVLQLIPPISRTAFSNLYRCIGAALDGATDGYTVGDTTARRLLIEMDDVKRAVSAENSLNVVIFTDENLTQGITGDMLGTLAIELAGGFNLAIEGQGGSIDFDVIATSDPDVILCPDGCTGTVRSMRSLQNCAAIKNNAVYVYDVSKLYSFGTDFVNATWEIARLMHPSLITADMLPEGAVDYIPSTDHYVMDEDEYADYLAQQEAENGDEDGTPDYDDLFADDGDDDDEGDSES